MKDYYIKSMRALQLAGMSQRTQSRYSGTIPICNSGLLEQWIENDLSGRVNPYRYISSHE